MAVLGRGHLLDGLAGLVGQPLGHHDLHLGEEVTDVVAALDATALEPQDAAARRARRDLDLDRAAVERGHGNGRPEGGLRERDREVEGEVVALPAEDRVLVDRDGEDEVAGRSTGIALTAFAAQTDPLTVLDPGRDAGVDAPEVGRAERDRGALDGVAEADARARLDVGPGPGACGRAVAAVAGTGRAAPEHLAEDVLEVGLRTATGVEPDALSAGTAGTAGAAERGEDVLETCALTTGTARREARPAVRHGADRVVLAALLGVAEDGIRLPDLLEALLGLGVPDVVVGVHGAGDLAVGLLDRRGVGVLGHAEDRVEVLLEPVLTSHGAPPPSR